MSDLTRVPTATCIVQALNGYRDSYLCHSNTTRARRQQIISNGVLVGCGGCRPQGSNRRPQGTKRRPQSLPWRPPSALPLAWISTHTYTTTGPRPWIPAIQLRETPMTITPPVALSPQSMPTSATTVTLKIPSGQLDPGKMYWK